MTQAAQASQAQVLNGLIERARGSWVLLDLDDTLFSTARRHLRILREFAAVSGRQELERIGAEDLRYSIQDTLKDAGLHDPEFHGRLRAFWFARFFKNEYLGEDHPLPGAPAYCRALVEAGAKLAYVTGRDEGMREGTLEALERHGFPEPGRSVKLILKPSFDAPDLAFKTEALGRVAGWGAVAGGFENEPVHVNLFQETFPLARMVFVDTKHSGKPVSPLPEIPWIRDFRTS